MFTVYCFWSRIVTCTRLCRYAWTCVGRYLGAFGPLSVCVRAAMLELALAAICVRLGPLPVCAWGRYLCALGAAICVRLGPLCLCVVAGANCQDVRFTVTV